MFCYALLITAFIASSVRGVPIEQGGTSSSGFPLLLAECLNKIRPEVCDPHNVLQTEQRQRLNVLLEHVQQSTKRDGYPLNDVAKKCGAQGIILPTILLKADMIDTESVQRQLNEVAKQYTEQHPCERIAFLMLNAGEKVEQRKFWTGRNWNVNVEPEEMVAMYRKEIPLIKEAKYGDALHNIVEQFMAMATQRLAVPFKEISAGTTNKVVTGKASPTNGHGQKKDDESSEEKKTKTQKGEDSSEEKTKTKKGKDESSEEKKAGQV